jgi:hypothetical protein
MRCKDDDCPRRAYTSGWCSTHYRRLRSGQTMDAPIRRYVRIEEPVGGPSKPADKKPAQPAQRKRMKPFEAEWALLRELGLA